MASYRSVLRFIASDIYLSTLLTQLNQQALTDFEALCEACPAQTEYQFNQWAMKQKRPSTKQTRIIDELFVCFLNSDFNRGNRGSGE